MIDCSRSSGDEDDKKLEEDVPVYVIEVAISSRAQCKRCDEKIEKRQVKVGMDTEYYCNIIMTIECNL